MSRKAIVGFLFVIGAICFLAGCSSPAGRYIKYRLSPDKLPTKGETVVSVAGLHEPLTILLDEHAIPHIRAGNEEDLFFGLGYMQGRDRRFQMEVLKMLSFGRMRELVGDADSSGVMTRLEVFGRLLGFYQDAQDILDTAAPEDLALMEAFAAGVNAATEAEPVPFEFRVLGYTPEPWTPKDTTVILAMTAFGLTKNWEHELGRLELIMHQIRIGQGAERALSIWKPRYDMPPHLIGEKPETDPFADIPEIAPELVEYFTEFAKENPSVEGSVPDDTRRAEFANYLDTFFKGNSASNNWAVDGNWTGTGKAALSSDPHMPHMLPPLGYLSHLECVDCEEGSYKIIGGTFAGLPAVAFGTNGHVAWGETSNWADMADLFVEKPFEGKPGYYEYMGKAEPFTVREEVFKIRQNDGTYTTETRTVRETRHGVIVNDIVDRIGDDYPLVAMSRNHYHGKPINAIGKLYRSKNVKEAMEAVCDFYTLIGHWALADDSGNIGYIGSAKLPKRTKSLGTVPVPGWTGTYEWEDSFTIEELPYAYNPETGYLGTANNQVVQPESFGYPINFEGNVPFRWQRINQYLEKGKGDMTPVEALSAPGTDGKFMGWELLQGQFETALSDLQTDDDELVGEAARILISWDGQMTHEEVAPTIFNTMVAMLLKRNMKDEVSPATMDFYMSYFNLEPFVFDMLSDATNPAWDDLTTTEVEIQADVIADTFRIAVASLTERYGKKIEKWTWGNSAPFILEHAFGGQKALAKHVNRGPIPTMGGTDTVFPHQHTRKGMTHFPIKYGAVLRVVVDFNDLEGSEMSVPGGQSGRPTSKHYDDLLPFFLTGTGVSMDLDFDRIEKRTKATIVLNPKD